MKAEKIMDVHSMEYGFDGELLEQEDGTLLVRFLMPDSAAGVETPQELRGRTFSRTLMERKDIEEVLLEDYGWMSMEDLYEDAMLGLEE
jgi:hypothetical protein